MNLQLLPIYSQIQFDELRRSAFIITIEIHTSGSINSHPKFQIAFFCAADRLRLERSTFIQK